MALRQRLLHDLAEIQTRPYENIKVVSHPDNITKACLVLKPNPTQFIHLIIYFGDDYPLKPPQITCQTAIDHPNILGSYVCASILNTTEGYTPAYSLKSICIQLLSFFSSESLEQDYGGTKNLNKYRHSDGTYKMFAPDYRCQICESGIPADPIQRAARPASSYPENSLNELQTPVTTKKRRRLNHVPEGMTPPALPRMFELKSNPAAHVVADDDRNPPTLSGMPDEILINICSQLEVEELAPLIRAWNRIGGPQGVVAKYNIIRNRELVCFCLKKSFEVAKLGIGVNVAARGRQGTLESEFDLLSLQAFKDFQIRRSVQGLPFEFWLPLPISRRHYVLVRDFVRPRLESIGVSANLPKYQLPGEVIYAFMNDIVVKLSAEASNLNSGIDLLSRSHSSSSYGSSSSRSSLGQASEKAIESYYHLFHLLLCLATENKGIVDNINRKVAGVLDGQSSKQDIPNLGHLLITILIADADMDETLLMAIIRETVVRNVVWMLDTKGAGKAELAYMEGDKISQYRLKHTFEASLTSYRLLMFLNLFRQTINRGSSSNRKSLVQLREELFDAHGAPPKGTAARLAASIRDLQAVDSFPKFLAIMGLPSPPASQFTNFLRDCVEESMRKGYSVWGINQADALFMRLRREPGVKVRTQDEMKREWAGDGYGNGSFFPRRSGFGCGRGGSKGGKGGGGGRYGR